jgi:hypothetical protein
MAILLVVLTLSMLAADIYVVITIQVHDEIWSNTYEALGSLVMSSIKQTSDGGYIIAGAVGRNAFLVKTDADGNMQWNRTVSISDSIAMYAGDASDGGYMVIGSTTQGLLVLETNPNGVPGWNTTTPIGSQQQITCAAQTTDGGYIVAGPNLLMKLDSAGDMQWNKAAGNSQIICVRQTSDNGYALSGYVGSGVYEEASLAKANATGDLQWQKTYNVISEARCVQETPDGGYLMAGENLLIRLDQNGNVLWNKTYQGEYSANVFISSIQNTSDGGYIIAGTTGISVEAEQFCLVKTDSQTNLTWKKILPEYAVGSECFIQQTSGGYVIAGLSSKSPYRSAPYFWAAKVEGQFSTTQSALQIGLSAAIPLAASASLILCYEEYRSTKRRNKIGSTSSDHP